jgi:cytochrome P450
VAAQVDGALSEDELQGALLNLLFAAHDTTRYQFGWVVQLLLRHGVWTTVGTDRTLVASAVDEAMRVEPALHIMLRKATTDVEYRNLLFPAGTLITLNIYAANHDPVVFPDPHRFDLARPNANRHLGFGHGGHLCLGHALARAEMAEALSVFLDRFPELHAAGEPWHEPGFSSMSGAERIPLAAGVVDGPPAQGTR